MSSWVLLKVVFAFFIAGFSQAAAQSCLPAWQPQSAAERGAWQLEREAWEHDLARLPRYLGRLPAEPDTALLMPVEGVRVAEVTDTWNASRSGGRIHEGQDIFAAEGTPVYSSTDGFVWRISERHLGGLSVTVVGAGGRRYYYAHLSRYAEGLSEGARVTTETLLGYVGMTGNALGTPPHLHLGVSTGDPLACARVVYDPLPLLVDR